MAIRFVDKENEADAPGAKTPRPAVAFHAPTLDLPSDEGASDAEAPVDAAAALPYAKPEPKQKGRKPPVARPAKAEVAAPVNEDTPAEALLPGLQLHAKPTPKPRGRKKAFG